MEGSFDSDLEKLVKSIENMSNNMDDNNLNNIIQLLKNLRANVIKKQVYLLIKYKNV